MTNTLHHTMERMNPFGVNQKFFHTNMTIFYHLRSIIKKSGETAKSDSRESYPLQYTYLWACSVKLP